MVGLYAGVNLLVAVLSLDVEGAEALAGQFVALPPFSAAAGATIGESVEAGLAAVALTTDHILPTRTLAAQDLRERQLSNQRQEFPVDPYSSLNYS